jgi:RNA polymerase sigma-70 factor, ECF subfamily
MIASHDRLKPERLGNAQSIGKAKQVRARARTPLSGRILAEIPHLRAYARLMTNDRCKADQGVEETLKCVLLNGNRWLMRRRLRVPLFAILRNLLARDDNMLHKELRNGFEPQETVTPDSLGGFGNALALLHLEDREAIILTAAAGFTDLDTAEICGCAPEIIRGTVQRGLARLVELLPAHSAGLCSQ